MVKGMCLSLSIKEHHFDSDPLKNNSTPPYFVPHPPLTCGGLHPAERRWGTPGGRGVAAPPRPSPCTWTWSWAARGDPGPNRRPPLGWTRTPYPDPPYRGTGRACHSTSMAWELREEKNRLIAFKHVHFSTLLCVKSKLQEVHQQQEQDAKWKKKSWRMNKDH